MKIKGYLADNIIFYGVEQDKHWTIDGKNFTPEPQYIAKLTFIPHKTFTQEEIEKIKHNTDKAVLELGE